MKNQWTPQEEQELINAISEHKGKLAEAFRAFHATHRNRSIGAIQHRWYGVLRLNNDVRTIKPTEKPKKHNHLFMLVKKILHIL